MKRFFKFDKGDFITQESSPGLFAIFSGDVYEPTREGEEAYYSLICYYNPSHFEQNSENKWVCEKVFEYDLDNDETCEYTINVSDIEYWRRCSQEEINSALKILADKGLAWMAETSKFRKLGANEQLKFGTPEPPKNTGICGGNVYRNNPAYAPKQKTNCKIITKTVDINWEQKTPITCMDDKRRNFIAEQCDKLKFAFNTYSVNTYGCYPRRNYDYGDDMEYGMRAYRELMQGDYWGYGEDY